MIALISGVCVNSLPRKKSRISCVGLLERKVTFNHFLFGLECY